MLTSYLVVQMLVKMISTSAGSVRFSGLMKARCIKPATTTTIVKSDK